MRKLWCSIILFCLISVLPLYALAAEPKIELFAGAPDRKSASFSVGKPHTWYILCTLPQNTDSVHVIQTLSPALSLLPDSVSVRLLRPDGTMQELEQETHCQVISGTVHVEKGTSDRLCVSLTDAGLQYLSEFPELTKLQILYQATINQAAEPGIQILGSAQLNITDHSGSKTIYLSDRAAVTTGGIRIHLSGPEDEPLKGGKFMLARKATEGELSDRSITKEILDTGNETIAVIYEQFYDEIWNRTDVAVTDEDGNAALMGLAYGEYYLVQTESVRNDLFPAKPIPVTVNEVSHLTLSDGWKDSRGQVADNTLQIVNSRLVMPQTGGPGTIAYTASGMLVLLSAAMLLWYNRKRTVYI